MFQGRTTIAAPLQNRARRARGLGGSSIVIALIVAIVHAAVSLSTTNAADADARANGNGAQVNRVPIDISLIAPIAFPDTPQWRYIPDPAPTSFGSPVRVIIPGTGKIGDEVENVLIAPAAKQVVVVSKSEANAKNGRTTSYVCNYGTGAIDAVWNGDTEVPMCISRDGTRMLCQTAVEVGRAKNELVLYEFDAGKARPIVAWKPYSQELRDEVEWAAFVDSDKLLTTSTGGAIALWDLSTLRPVWTGTVDREAIVALSGGRNTLAVVSQTGVKLINVSDGRVVGDMSANIKHASAAAFSADGKRLAVCSGWLHDRILVWNLSDGRLDRDFGLLGDVFQGKRLDWADATHLLVGGSVVVDVDRRVEIWRFNNVGVNKNNFAVDAGRLWFLNSSLAQAATLGSLAIPTRQSLATVSNLKPEQLLVLQPGSEIALELSGDGDVNGAREAFTKQLTDNEMKIVPQGSIRLVGQTKILPAQRVRVRNVGQPGGAMGTEYEFTPRMAMLSLYVGNELVWQRTRQFGPIGFIDLKEGESVDQALVRLTTADLMSLTSFEVPRYLARIP